MIIYINTYNQQSQVYQMSLPNHLFLQIINLSFDKRYPKVMFGNRSINKFFKINNNKSNECLSYIYCKGKNIY